MSNYNFSEFNQCDHCALDLLRSHLMHVEKSEMKYSHIQEFVRQFREALEQSAFITLSKSGTTQFITQQAKVLLKKYFPSLNNGVSFPPYLKKWCDYQISQLVINQSTFYPISVLNIEQDTQHLMIHLIVDPNRDYYVLLLEEKRLVIFSVADLELLGLSRRRSQVLFWIARDKSNAEIAKILGCSEGTIRKHLEFIYKQLNVHTRAGAVIAVLEKLGILRYLY